MRVFRTIRIIGGAIFADFFGGLMARAARLEPVTTLTYGASIAIDASLGNLFTVTVTDAVAFAFAAPTNTPPTGFSQEITITVRNTSGGAHGAGTWNAVFKTAGNVPAIATGNSRSFSFKWDGTNWVETFRSAADVAN